MFMELKRGQVSVEYLILVGFLTFIIIGILGLSFYYSNSVQDQIKSTQVQSFANKLISTSERVFYSGKPSKATITAYLPEGIQSIEFYEGGIVIAYKTASGLNKNHFESNVQIFINNIDLGSGIKKLEVTANETTAIITQI